mgnify:CR=1 FL=1
MEVRKPAKFLLIIAILFYLLSAVMLYKGYDKMTNYSNPEYSFMTTHNAYVGGDAYNYIINGNYAIPAGFKTTDALATESATSLAAEAYANVLVVKDGNQDSDKIKALVKALTSDEVRTYINDTYAGAVVPVF